MCFCLAIQRRWQWAVSRLDGISRVYSEELSCSLDW